MSSKLLKKISTKDVLGGAGILTHLSLLQEAASKPDKTVWLMSIMGITSRARTGLSKETDKEFIQFIGEFEAVNLLTNEEFKSSRCFVPDFIADAIYANMRDAETGEMNEAQFAIKVGAHYDPTAIRLYVYDIQSLVEPQPTDKMKMLKHLALHPQPLQLGPTPAGKEGARLLNEYVDDKASFDEGIKEEAEMLEKEEKPVADPGYIGTQEVAEAATVHSTGHIDLTNSDDLNHLFENPRSAKGSLQVHKGKHDKHKSTSK